MRTPRAKKSTTITPQRRQILKLHSVPSGSPRSSITSSKPSTRRSPLNIRHQSPSEMPDVNCAAKRRRDTSRPHSTSPTMSNSRSKRLKSSSSPIQEKSVDLTQGTATDARAPRRPRSGYRTKPNNPMTGAPLQSIHMMLDRSTDSTQSTPASSMRQRRLGSDLISPGQGDATPIRTRSVQDQALGLVTPPDFSMTPNQNRVTCSENQRNPQPNFYMVSSSGLEASIISGFIADDR
eukprot:976646_1